MKLNPTDLRTYPVQKKPCKTCPFAGETPLIIPQSDLVNYYENLFGNGQHFCHSTSNRKFCRGGRNIQLKWLCAVGILDEPTDKAFDEEINKVLSK